MKDYALHRLQLPFMEQAEYNKAPLDSQELFRSTYSKTRLYSTPQEAIEMFFDGKLINLTTSRAHFYPEFMLGFRTGSKQKFWSTYIAPILDKLSLPTTPSTLYNLYFSQTNPPSRIPYADRELYNIAEVDRGQFLKVTQGSLLQDLFNKPEVFTSYARLERLPETKVEDLEQKLNEIQNKLEDYKAQGHDINQIRNLVDTARELNVTAEKGKYSTRTFFKMEIRGLSNNQADNQTLTHYSYVRLPKANEKPTPEDIQKIFTSPQKVNTYIAPDNEGVQGELNKQIAVILYKIAEVQEKDILIEPAGLISPNSIEGLNKKNYTDPTNPINLARRSKGRPDVQVYLRSFLPNEKSTTTSYVTNPEAAPILNINLFRNSEKETKGTSYKGVETISVTGVDLRRYIESAKNEVENIVENYYIDKEVYDYIQQGAQGDPDPEGLGTFFRVNRSGVLEIQPRSKSSNLGLRYEHLVPVAAMQRFFQIYLERKSAYFDDTTKLQQSIQKEIPEILKKIYFIAYIAMDKDRALDSNYKSSLPTSAAKVFEDVQFDESGNILLDRYTPELFLSRYKNLGIEVIPLKQLFRGASSLKLKGYTNQDLAQKLTESKQKTRTSLLKVFSK